MSARPLAIPVARALDPQLPHMLVEWDMEIWELKPLVPA